MSSIFRNDAKLQKLVDNSTLTEQGKRYLRTAIDPMADELLTSIPGIPDGIQGVSLRRPIKQSFAIAKPANLGAGNWDCHISVDPVLHKFKATRYNRIASSGIGDNLLDYDNTLQVDLGGVNAYATESGQQFSYQTAEFCGQATLDVTYEAGASRVVAVGIEAQNTTAEIYKQGSVCVYRQNQAPVDRSSTFNVCIPTVSDAPVRECFSGVMVRRPPLSFADAMLLPGSRQWNASEGAYEVVSFSSEDNPPRMPDYVQPIMDLVENEDDVGTGGSVVNTTPLLGPTITFMVPPGNTNVGSVAGCKVHPINRSGMVFTGLSEQTTLQVYVNFYIETFPTPAQKEILVLATPTAPRDETALAMFSECMRKMPVGVPSSMNGLGEWFAAAVKAATTFLPPFLMSIGRPVLAGAIASAAPAVNQYLAPASPNSNFSSPSGKSAKKRKRKNNNQKKGQKQQQQQQQQNSKQIQAYFGPK